MNNPNDVKKFLAKPDIHRSWIAAYRTKENDVFFDMAFKRIVELCHINENDKILDAGCGSANHTIRFAKKGLHVTAIDYSEPVLEMAYKNLRDLNLLDKVILKQEDLTALSFADNSFSIAYCWGVLMHIPDVETAIKELCRVVQPGGYIIISEGNKNSIEASLRRNIVKLLSKKKGRTTIISHRGIENWYDKGDTKFFVRQANMSWLTETFLKNNAVRKYRISGQFTELYTSFKAPFIRKLIHVFNNFWFKNIRIPHLSVGNILIFEKK